MRGLVLLLAALVGVALASDVVILTESNFDEVIKENEFVLVEFFAPWCGHCKKLAPEYEVAATALKDEGIVLASVDATEEKDLGGRFGVRGYPTLKFFRNGEATEYKGGRTSDTIISYLRKKTGPAAKALASADELEAFKTSGEVVVVGFFASIEGKEYQNFVAAASADEDRSYAYTTDADLAAAEGASQPGLVLYKKFDEGKNVYDGKFARPSIEDFVATNAVPLVIPFTMEVVGSIFQSKVGKVGFLFSKEDIPALRDVATQFKGKMVFAYTDGSVDRLNSHVGVEASDLPKFIILETAAQMKKFPLAGVPTGESMTAHIESYLAGDLKPWFKSEKVPEDNSGPVTTIVGDNFNEIVLDENKDVLLEVYAPWCGHCKKLVPIYDELGEAFQSNPNIVIAKMDGTANEIDGLAVRGFPTIKFYPAGKKTSAGTEYKGGRELADFKDFLAKNAKNAAGHDEL